MTLGKAISLFLIDASPTGRVAAELYNWTGKAYKIPRTQLQESADRTDLRKAGIYFLFGREEVSHTSTVYVGEAEEVYTRLKQHQGKDFWNEVLVFVSKDENLNKAHVKFLEAQAYKAILKANRATLQNASIPSEPLLSELERAVMLEFFENLKLLAGTLGYKIMEPVVSQKDKRTLYYLSAARGAEASAVITTEGITVLKNSRATLEVMPSASAWIGKLRQQLIDDRTLKTEVDFYAFTHDYTFSSPSTAASVIMGISANGLIVWKDKKGKSIKDNEGM